MINTSDLKNCCGCMACVSACPVDAIRPSVDKNGFSVPFVDTEKCIFCGACDKICAFDREKQTVQNVLGAYAFQLADKEALKNSTSGGAFTALSDAVLSSGGVVCGAVMDGFTVKHVFAEDKEGRDAMRLSKYVQSDTTDVFEEVKRLLSGGRQVMFTGTPCQTAELTVYLGRQYDNLLLCDFLCHGVPNQSLFSAHIAYLEEKYKKKAAGYSFRGKRYGWNHGIEEIVFSDGSYKDSRAVQSYSRFFQSGVSLRESCRNCKYRSRHRFSDITIADFWGIEKVMGRQDAEGYSLLFVNTAQGRCFAETLSAAGSLDELPLDKVLYRISEKPASSKSDPEVFWKTFREQQYGGVVERYAKSSLLDSLKHEIKKKKSK